MNMNKMTKYKVEKTAGVYEDVEADGMTVDGPVLVFFRVKQGIMTPGNPQGQAQPVPFKIFNQWISVTDTSINNS